MRTGPHEHPDRAPTEREIALIVTSGSQRAERAGQRMTEPRRRVFEMLVSAGRPLKACQLAEQFHPDGRAAKPPTVYRALEFLERLGLLHRISSNSSYVACSGEVQGTHAAAFLICDDCGATREFAAPASADMARAAAMKGYTIERVSMELHGACASCRAG
jgi:Fur family transcriptional regulator, zinc uptake regulator